MGFCHRTRTRSPPVSSRWPCSHLVGGLGLATSVQPELPPAHGARLLAHLAGRVAAALLRRRGWPAYAPGCMPCEEIPCRLGDVVVVVLQRVKCLFKQGPLCGAQGRQTRSARRCERGG